MARHLVQMGHPVTMIAEVPNHPSGVIPPAYRGKLYERADLDGIEVLRVWVKASPVKTSFTRMAFYLSYMVNATLAGIWLAKGKYDLVFASSPPLFVACAGWAISRLRGIPFVFDVRDLWPAVAVSLGELRSPRLLRWAEKVERFLYRRAAMITAVTRGFCVYIENLGIPASRIHWAPNGSTPELFTPGEPDPRLLASLGLQGKFVVTFAGLHGIAQGLPSILDTARSLLDHPEVAFLFIGEGPVKRALISRCEEEGLTNVHFVAEMPREQVVPYLNSSDALLVPLKNDPIFETFIPSKLFDFMACGRPVLLSVPGEARQILEETGAGSYVPPEDPAALKSAILQLAALTPEERRQIGQRGRQMVIEKYSRASQARQLAELLGQMLGK